MYLIIYANSILNSTHSTTSLPFSLFGKSPSVVIQKCVPDKSCLRMVNQHKLYIVDMFKTKRLKFKIVFIWFQVCILCIRDKSGVKNYKELNYPKLSTSSNKKESYLVITHLICILS